MGIKSPVVGWSQRGGDINPMKGQWWQKVKFLPTPSRGPRRGCNSDTHHRECEVARISTSHIERANLPARMHIRRFLG